MPRRYIIEPLFSELGANMRQARRRAGLTQSQVAQIMGKNKFTVADWETARRRIKIVHLVRYAHAVDARVEELVRGC